MEFREDGRLDGPTNMAADIALLDLAEQGRAGCRIYAWNGPWVSLGRFQSPERDLVKADATNWVIRPTGGKAVLHGHDITVGFAMPLSSLGLETRSLRSVYREMVQPLIVALQACGVPAALAEQTRFGGRGLRTADCFALSSPNDVVDETSGQKVCGCALRLTDTAVLLQASLPNGKPLISPKKVIRNAALSYREWDATNFAPALEDATVRASSGNHAGSGAPTAY